mmetsp:Transcript_18182/g.46551  ORF Transcript_18182/g.46551 Transcript_18182/m.46551 type:complete len:222 (+) Transcript_18182:462-1127(+)
MRFRSTAMTTAVVVVEAVAAVAAVAVAVATAAATVVMGTGWQRVRQLLPIVRIIDCRVIVDVGIVAAVSLDVVLAQMVRAHAAVLARAVSPPLAGVHPRRLDAAAGVAVGGKRPVSSAPLANGSTSSSMQVNTPTRMTSQWRQRPAPALSPFLALGSALAEGSAEVEMAVDRAAREAPLPDSVAVPVLPSAEAVRAATAAPVQSAKSAVILCVRGWRWRCI